MPRSKRSLSVIAVALVLGLAAYLIWLSPDPGAGDLPQDSSLPAVGESAPEPEDDEAGAADEPQELARRARQLGETRQSELRELRASQETFPHSVRMDDYKAALWSEIQAAPPAIETPGDPALDAETAYRLYMYYGMCSMMPRTRNQIDRQLEEIEERARTARRGRLESLESRADQMVDSYELCQAIPPDVDCRMEAVLWMTEAVRLGHEIAQVQFYEKAMGFLLRPDPFSNAPPLVMRHPGLIGEFKATANLALSQALEKGHPEAWLAMSRAVFDGVVFPEDAVLALAYARVAEAEAMENRIILRGLEEQTDAIIQRLDPAQVAEAEELARRLPETGFPAGRP
ncbi:MAG: hypothetical protein MUE63_03810 [Xanthomonadales bacterium]|nr:hypothetical protein [Xanthomonadales bacterium]